MACSTSASFPAARWTRWRSGSPTRWSATERKRRRSKSGVRARARVRVRRAGRAVRRAVRRRGRRCAAPPIAPGARASGHAPADRPRRGRRAYLAVAGGIASSRCSAAAAPTLRAVRRLAGPAARARRDPAARAGCRGARRGASRGNRRRRAIAAGAADGGVVRARRDAARARAARRPTVEGQHSARSRGRAQRVLRRALARHARVEPHGISPGGPRLARGTDGEILSEPTCLGTVQVPASGMPIALMADHQTTGGYPKIAEIAAADVPRLAQLAPGGTVQFARCTLRAAGELRRAMRRGGSRRRLAWNAFYGSAEHEDDRPQLRHGRELRRLEDGRRRRRHAAHHLGQHRLRLPRRRSGDHPQDGAPRGRPRRRDRRASVAARPAGLRPARR